MSLTIDKPITGTELVAKVKELGERYPNNYYEPGLQKVGCLYDSGKNTECPVAGCIIGVAIKELRPDFPYFDAMNNAGEFTSVVKPDEFCGDGLDVFVDMDITTQYFLNDVQAFQDTGYSWGDAIGKANGE